ncbi:MFS transporter [Lysinibacillus yapensis]|nr:MFS transporter [Lysinibacillus yapensis]
MLIHETTKIKMNYPLMSFILTWSGLVILMSMFVTVPLTSVFMHDLHISETDAAWIGSIYSFCFAIGCLIYGPLSDKYGRKIFLMASTLVLAAVTFITGFVHDFELLLAMRALQGFASAAFAPVSLVYASDMFPPHKRLTVTGYIISGFLMAGIIAQVFGIMISTRFGWSAIFIIMGIVYFITALLVIFYLPKDSATDKENSILSKYIQMKDIFKNLKLCISFYIMFTVYFSLIGMYTFLGDYLHPYGFTEKDVLPIRALAIISMLTSVFAGKISSKFGVQRSLRSALALASFSLLFMGLATSANLIILGSLLFVAGIAYVVPINVSLVVKNSGLARGSAVLFNAFMLFLGASIGPILATSLAQGGNYLLAFGVLSGFLLIGLIASFFLKD